MASDDKYARFKNPETSLNKKGRLLFEVYPEDIECTFTPTPALFDASSTRFFPSTPGTHKFNMCEKKDGLIVVPASYDASKPTALLLALHGATGTPEHQLGLYRPMSSRNVILVVPASRLYTWDLIVSRGQYGPDVAFLNHLLFRVFSTYNVDPEKLAIGGFSDGASYAASLGMSNGELFKNLLINSPGFAAPLSMLGKPRIFVSHGTEDKVLPIANCSRRLVPMLKQAGYPTEYVEFRGGHELKRDILQKMLAWWLDESKSSI